MQKLIPIALGIVVIAVAAVFFTGNKENTHAGEEHIEQFADPSLANTLLAILKIEDKDEQKLQLDTFFLTLLSEDVDRALELINALQQEKNRSLCYTSLLSEWYKHDANAMQNWLAEATPNFDLDQALAKLSGHSDIAITQRLNFAALIANSSERDNVIAQLINANSVENTQAVITWALDPSANNTRWIDTIFERLNQESLELAISALDYFEDAPLEALRIAIQSMINNFEPGTADETTLAAIESLSVYEIKEEFIGAFLPILAQEQALTLSDLDALLQGLLPGETQDAFYAQLMRSWALRDPQEAAEFAANMESDAKGEIINGVVESWMQTDLVATDEWLKTIDGDIDTAANTLGRGSAEAGNVQVANYWINDIEDETMRTDAIVNVLQTYYKESPEAGIYHLVYQQSLSNDQKLELLHEIYPNELFISPMQALDEIGRLENLQSGLPAMPQQSGAEEDIPH